MIATLAPAAPRWPRLAAADEALASTPWRSLAPGRERARTLVAIASDVLGSDPEPAAAQAWVDALADIALAMQRAFPDNLFGDLELLAATLWRHGQAVPAQAALVVRREGERIEGLQRLFGGATAIRFRYVHDFLYGYDWAKWVARDPATRATVGPFDPELVQSMDERGHELLELIAAGNDRKYPPLPDGRPRNPFGFSREPAHELQLHRLLAREGALPVEAWRYDALPRWDRPYAALRREAAARLGLHDAAAAPCPDPR